MTFRVGQKVVCVNAGQSRFCFACTDSPNYVKGAVYTITGFREFLDQIGVFLAELPDEGESWISHDVARFRPIVERKTDISIFTRMLNPSKVEANA